MTAVARRPRLASTPDRVAAVEDWQEGHERKCEERMTAVNARLAALEASSSRTEGKVDLLIGAFLREKEHPDGSTSVMWKLPKFSGKTILGLITGAGGVVICLQLLFVMGIPALQAGFDWIMHYGRH